MNHAAQSPPEVKENAHARSFDLPADSDSQRSEIKDLHLVDGLAKRDDQAQMHEIHRGEEPDIAKRIVAGYEEKLALRRFGKYDPSAEFKGLSWNDFVKDFLADCKRRLRPGSAEAYEHSLKEFTHAVKPKLLHDVSVKMIRDFVAQRLVEHREPQTINKDLRHVRASLNWAAASEYLAVAPSFKRLMLPTDRADPRVVSKGEQEAVFRALAAGGLELQVGSSAWWRVFLQIALFTGARRGEIFGLVGARVSDDDGAALCQHAQRAS